LWTAPPHRSDERHYRIQFLPRVLRVNANIRIRMQNLTTTFAVVVLNDFDRFHFVKDAIERLSQLGARAEYGRGQCLTVP
jgi:phosphoketolase